MSFYFDMSHGVWFLISTLMALTNPSLKCTLSNWMSYVPVDVITQEDLGSELKLGKKSKLRMQLKTIFEWLFYLSSSSNWSATLSWDRNRGIPLLISTICAMTMERSGLPLWSLMSWLETQLQLKRDSLLSR